MVRSWIDDIIQDFDHILIMEQMSVSLAIMMIKFCWSIDDVVNLKLNSRSRSETIKPTVANKIAAHNWADQGKGFRFLRKQAVHP